MKQYFIALFFGTALTWAQSTTTTYHRDINGRSTVVATSSVTADGEKSQELVETINGRTIPRSQISEKILVGGEKHSVRERVTRDLDPNGVVSGTTRLVIEATAGSGGSKTVKETTYRAANGNGPLQEEQHSTADTRVEGNVITTEVVVERKEINRPFAVAERRNIVTTGTAQSRQTVETVLHPDQSGRLTLFQRQETNVVSKDGETKITTSLYDSVGSSAELMLNGQQVTTITTKPDGTQIRETNIYVPAGLGRAQSLGSKPDLQEQQILERHENADGSVTERLSVRTPISTDSGRLGPVQLISETVCRGKCITPLSADDGQPPALEQSRISSVQRK